MNIKPSSPQGPHNPAEAAALDSARTAAARKADTGPQNQAVDAERSRPRPDSADVSAEARALSDQRDVRQAGSSLEPERLKEVTARIESGFYDQPEVIGQVARGVAKDPDFLKRT